METILAIAFMIFALGFFVFILQFVRSADRELYQQARERRQQRLDEIREFGEEKLHRPILREILKKF